MIFQRMKKKLFRYQKWTSGFRFLLTKSGKTIRSVNKDNRRFFYSQRKFTLHFFFRENRSIYLEEVSHCRKNLNFYRFLRIVHRLDTLKYQ